MNNLWIHDESSSSSWLDHRFGCITAKLTLENILAILIILAAIISRFASIGERVMSHDEVNHVVPSYDLYMGEGYSHNPVTHGPLQFHLIAASYFLMGDSDFSSRVPAALFSIATIVFVLFAFRQYLGRTGALLSGFFFLISPFMLFYGRYTRNEAFIGLFSVVLLYFVLHYLEEGKHSSIYIYTTTLALYFCTKETAYIFTAEMLIFLAILFLKDITQTDWKNKRKREIFIILTITALLFIGTALGVNVIDAKNHPTTEADISMGEDITAATATPALTFAHTATLLCLGLALIILAFAVWILIADLGWAKVKEFRSCDLLILTFTLVLPQLTAIPVSLLGWDPLDYSQSGLIHTSIVFLFMVVLAVVIGILWKPSLWVKNAVIFYFIFIALYTTFFTNGLGFFTGIVGSLGYWLSQQAFHRGTQSWYYYIFPQILMYEYLSALGTLTALIIGFKHKLFCSIPLNFQARQNAAEKESQISEIQPSDPPASVEKGENPKRLPVLALFIYWSIMSLAAFTVAGEKMPWLTVHIALPMLLAAGFGLGYLVDNIAGIKWNTKHVLSFLLIPIAILCAVKVIGMIINPNKPFSGMEIEKLQYSSTLLLSIIAFLLSGWGIRKLMTGCEFRYISKVILISAFVILSVLTARSAFQANFINYDNGKEFLVYAHAGRGPKDILAQVEDISKRTTGGKDIKVAYIGEASYPYWWYFRDYPNSVWIAEKLTRDLKQYPIVISDDIEITKARAILDENYFEFTYKRLVWPMENYNRQTIPTLWAAIQDPQIRKAVFNIWLNKDYTLYAQLKGLTSLTVEKWEPSRNIYLFIKKDLVSSIWTYGTVPPPEDLISKDPYAVNMIDLVPDAYFGTAGNEAGQLSKPHGIAAAKDNSVFVVDTGNNRIQHFSADGQLINSWGTFASVDTGEAPGGTFNEPWGIAVGPDGSVYVADTWNHRIQKFTPDGKFLTMWGKAGLADSGASFWGPRGIAVNRKGQVFVTDTGNNRVVIYDAYGKYINQFGINGIAPGEFDEPVGLAFDNEGNLFVIDTWNQRVQVFQSQNNDETYRPIREWVVKGWDGQSVNNKPFISVDVNGRVYVTDPESYRVLMFDSYGNYIGGWGDYSSDIDGFGMPSGITVDELGNIFVSDTENNRILRFSILLDSREK